MTAPLTIAYFGLPLAALALREDGHRLAFSVLSPVEAPGRRRMRRLGLGPMLDASDASAEALEAQIDALWHKERVDLLVSWFWTRRLPARWLALPRLGSIGCHPSLLPRHRGPDPYFWTIDSGDELAGVSVHFLESRYDTGSVLAQSSIPVGHRNAWQLARALDRPGLALLRAVTHQFATDSQPFGVPQDSELATWAPSPNKSDLRVDWNWTTKRILRRIRALAPTPGIAVDIEGVRFRIVEASGGPCSVQALRPGEAFVGEEVAIQTGDGAVNIERVWLSEPDEERLACGSELAALVSERRVVVSSPTPGGR